jgi:hypothetical protein
MRRPRVRLTLRQMLVAVLAATLATWAVLEWMRPGPFARQRFALIGPLDLDGDGRDDRATLTRMIRRAGGSIDFDLPPSGPPLGAIGPATTWYVLDPRTSRPPRPAAESSAVARARLEGARPIALDRLVSRLGGP